MVKLYTYDEVMEIARRGERDPASLTADEIRAVGLYVVNAKSDRCQCGQPQLAGMHSRDLCSIPFSAAVTKKEPREC